MSYSRRIALRIGAGAVLCALVPPNALIASKPCTVAELLQECPHVKLGYWLVDGRLQPYVAALNAREISIEDRTKRYRISCNGDLVLKPLDEFQLVKGDRLRVLLEADDARA